DDEVHRFREIGSEFTFLIRTVFFIRFGFLIDIEQLADTTTLIYALGIVGSILLVRIVQLKLSGIPLIPLVTLAPRGLITILLFISIPEARQIALVSESLMIQIIVISALLMMVGLMAKQSQK